MQQAGPSARGATAYLNLEPGDCHGDDTAVRALVEAGVNRVVVGLPHPLGHHRGSAISALRAAGVRVAVLPHLPGLADTGAQRATIEACLAVNEARRAPLLSSALCMPLPAPANPGIRCCIFHALTLAALQALLHRAATGRPFSILKYAMTLDGKIATSAGHAAWVSCAESRARVFATRAR